MTLVERHDAGDRHKVIYEAAVEACCGPVGCQAMSKDGDGICGRDAFYHALLAQTAEADSLLQAALKKP